MIRKFLVPLVALLGFGFALWFSFHSAKEVPPAAPVTQPAASNFTNAIAGSGIIEANTENITIGTNLPGIVTQMYVKVGDTVAKDAPLFLIDDRELQAELVSRQSTVQAAQAQVVEAQATIADLQNQVEIARELASKLAVSNYERDRKQFALKVAEAKLQTARSNAQLAQAQLKQTQTNLERLTVRAPVAGTILRVNVRLGEFAPSGEVKDPLILMGNVEPLNVRIDIDENDAWRFRPGMKAEGYLRGNRDIHTPLEFVRVEPYVVPKKSLTGDSSERVDTRVLQVIYAFPHGTIPAYVGQLMDVFIEDTDR